MKFEEIKNLLDKNEWYKVEGEERYLSTEDIYLCFDLGEWSDFPLADRPDNLLSFIRQLQDVFEVGSIQKAEVVYYYDGIKLQSLSLLLISGKDVVHYPNRPMNIYFSIPPTLKAGDKIENIFYLAIIKYFNNEIAMGKINHATGGIE